MSSCVSIISTLNLQISQSTHFYHVYNKYTWNEQCQRKHGAKAGGIIFHLGSCCDLLLRKLGVQWCSGWDVIEFLPSHYGIIGCECLMENCIETLIDPYEIITINWKRRMRCTMKHSAWSDYDICCNDNNHCTVQIKHSKDTNDMKWCNEY